MCGQMQRRSNVLNTWFWSSLITFWFQECLIIIIISGKGGGAECFQENSNQPPGVEIQFHKKVK